LNSFAAFRPKIFRFACSFRKGIVVIELGGSKSQCGQSEANNSWVSAPIEELLDYSNRLLTPDKPAPPPGPTTHDRETQAAHPTEDSAVVLDEDEVPPYRPHGFKI